LAGKVRVSLLGLSFCIEERANFKSRWDIIKAPKIFIIISISTKMGLVFGVA
jgi:hypothetical protein